MIEILTTGLLNSVQDLGRHGHLGLGVSRSGAMDADALRAANALVGNMDGAAALEVVLFPMRLRLHVDTMVACTGAQAAAKLDDSPLPPWWCRSVRAGQTLTLEAPASGARTYVAFAAGIDVPAVLGSRATDLKSGFGGLEGRGLRRGDRLPLSAAPEAPTRPVGLGLAVPERIAFEDELAGGCVRVRVMPAAEHSAFTDAARAQFYATPYRITPQSNRMGYRLEGAALDLVRPLELLSHGIVPGTVQVPPAGQPIVQLAEANTCGGYPKIATVIEADLWRLAQAPAGCGVRFECVDADTAVAALRAQRDALASIRDTLALMAGRA
jgi:5-oxoprolinase (ATP-hydrolysing) subunit C